MNDTEYRIDTVSYQNKKDHRIFQVCLSKWFKDPKTLQFTNPMMQSPFRFNKWVDLSYNQIGITTFILKHERWIIGHISVETKMESMSAHLFYLIIVLSHRRQGYANRLIFHLENILQEKNISRIILKHSSQKRTSTIIIYKIRV